MRCQECCFDYGKSSNLLIKSLFFFFLEKYLFDLLTLNNMQDVDPFFGKSFLNAKANVN